MARKEMTLWSWLTKHEAKNELYCPPELTVTNEEFAAELARQIDANRVPASVELCDINWADAGTRQMRILVRYGGTDIATDIVQYLVGVDQMGNFTYVEEKVYLRPPDLPKVPREKKSQGSKPAASLPTALGVIGACLIVLSLIIAAASRDAGGALCCLGGPGLGLVVAAFIVHVNNGGNMARWEEADRWNREAEQEQQAWDRALNAWYKDTLQAAYLSKTNDVFGRFALSVSSTVKQVIKTVFEDKQAEMRKRTEQERTQEEIEKELEKRKERGFKLSD